MSIPVSYYMIREEAVVVGLLRVDLHTRCLAPVNSEREIYHNNKTSDWRQSTLLRQRETITWTRKKHRNTDVHRFNLCPTCGILRDTQKRLLQLQRFTIIIDATATSFRIYRNRPEDKDDTSKGTYAPSESFIKSHQFVLDDTKHNKAVGLFETTKRNEKGGKKLCFAKQYVKMREREKKKTL